MGSMTPVYGLTVLIVKSLIRRNSSSSISTVFSFSNILCAAYKGFIVNKTTIQSTTGDTGTAKPYVSKIINSHLKLEGYFLKKSLSKGAPRVPRGSLQFLGCILFCNLA